MKICILYFSDYKLFSFGTTPQIVLFWGGEGLLEGGCPQVQNRLERFVQAKGNLLQLQTLKTTKKGVAVDCCC